MSVGRRAYACDTCHRMIRVESRGNPHPSPGDHDPAFHVAKTYRTGWTGAVVAVAVYPGRS